MLLKSQPRNVNLNRNSTWNHHVWKYNYHLRGLQFFLKRNTCVFFILKWDGSILLSVQKRLTILGVYRQRVDICSFVWLTRDTEISFWILTIVRQYCFPYFPFQLCRHNWGTGITLQGNRFENKASHRCQLAGYHSNHKSSGYIHFYAKQRLAKCAVM